MNFRRMEIPVKPQGRKGKDRRQPCPLTDHKARTSMRRQLSPLSAVLPSAESPLSSERLFENKL